MESADNKQGTSSGNLSETNEDGQVSYEATTDATPAHDEFSSAGTELQPVPHGETPAAPPPVSPPPPPPEADEEDDDGGMLRMSFLEHLEELRVRLIKALMGLGVAFAAALAFTDQLWNVVRTPAIEAMTQVGIKDPKLAQMTPMESFSIIWVKLPVLAAIFLASPWIGYQVWAFIAPGLYKKERRWAAPFVISTAGLFMLGGMFAYFVAFKLGLAFLLGIGVDKDIMPVISITEYFDLFVNVLLGMGLVFELPVLIFFLALLRIVTPGFLLRNSRYAILLIVVVAAIVTPTPDVINLMLISVPMTVLYFGGLFAAYLLQLSRDKQGFPWLILVGIVIGFLAVVSGGIYLAVVRFGYQLVPYYPFLIR